MAVFFYKLCENKEFKDRFYERAKEIINVNFAPARMQSIIDGYVEICQEWVEKTYTRFNMSNVYADKLKIMQNFYKNRPEHALAYLDKFCGKQ